MVGIRGVDAYRALAAIGARLHGEGEIGEAFELVVDAASELVGTEVSWLSLTDESGAFLRPEVLRSFRDPSFTDVTIGVTAGLGGRALKERSTVVVADYPSYVDAANPEKVWDALHSEGLISVMCSPMILQDKLVGALYVATRTAVSFGSADIALLEALASQATIAIENRRLYRRLAARNTALEQSLTVHRRLTNASAKGVGIAGIAQILADLLGSALVVESAVAGVEPVAIGTADRAPATSFPVRAGAEVVGSLTVFGNTAPTSHRLQAIEHGVTVLALESMKLRAQWEIEERLSAELLDDVLEQGLTSALHTRAFRFGVDLTKPYRVVVVGARHSGPDGFGTWVMPTSRGTRERGVLFTMRPDAVVIAVPDDAAVLEREIGSVVENMRGSGIEPSVGIGSAGSPAVSYSAAKACLRMARQGSRRSSLLDDAVNVVSYDDLGPLRFMLDADNVDHAELMIRAALQPVIDDDLGRAVPLLPTLRAFVMANGHYERASADLFIGLTTLKYRLGKIEERFGIDPKDPDTRFELRMAFELSALLDARK